MSIEVVPNVAIETRMMTSRISEPKTVYKTKDIAAFLFCSCAPQITIKRYIGHKINSNAMKKTTISRVQNATTKKISRRIKYVAIPPRCATLCQQYRNVNGKVYAVKSSKTNDRPSTPNESDSHPPTSKYSTKFTGSTKARSTSLRP
jgi:hypothetical protein